MSADRELRAEILVDAPAGRVWAVLTDLRNLVAASPELVAMVPLRRGGLREGQVYVGWNRRGRVVLPTRNRIVAVVPERRLAWDTLDSGARWIFDLSPQGERTLLTERRPVPNGLPWLSRAFAGALLGGGEGHAEELEQALMPTLHHLQQVAEN